MRKWVDSVEGSRMLSSEQNDEECDATGDDSSNAAGLKIKTNEGRVAVLPEKYTNATITIIF
jgi:hypothetical protein